jgi:glycosyltransferase 2 family protein
LKFVKEFLKYLLVGVIFYFLFRNLFSNWSEFSRHHFHPNFAYGALSIAAISLAWMLSAWNWGRVLAAFDCKVSYADVFIIYFKSNPGKYLPGKIWQIVGSAYFAVEKGIPEGVAISTSLIGQAYSVLSGLSLFAVALFSGLIGPIGKFDIYFKWTAIPFLAVLLVLAVRPDFGQPILNLVMRTFKRQEVKIRLRLSSAVELYFLYLFCWLIFGLALWAFANALTPTGFGSYIALTAILAAAVTIGFLALFAPGGLGVREGAIALFLSSMPAFLSPLPSAIAVGYRVISVIVELIAFGITWVIQWTQKK